MDFLAPPILYRTLITECWLN